MPACIIDGCPNNARHRLGVRLRRPRGPLTAIWAPDLNANLCDDHAVSGMSIEIILTPTNTHQIETETHSPGGPSVIRTTPIRNRV